jgi:hypothetical protein
MSDPTGQCLFDSFSLMFIHCFGRILLTEYPFDPILLLLALKLCGDHFYPIGYCFHNFISGVFSWCFERGT